jgi:hypothetical protein
MVRHHWKLRALKLGRSLGAPLEYLLLGLLVLFVLGRLSS